MPHASRCTRFPQKRGGAGFADQDGINPDAAFATGPNASSGLRAGAGTSPTRAAAGRAAAAVQLSTRAPPAPKIANAWRRAAAKALEVEHAHENGNNHSQGTTASGEADPLLGEYERRKLEEQGKVKGACGDWRMWRRECVGRCVVGVLALGGCCLGLGVCVVARRQSFFGGALRASVWGASTLWLKAVRCKPLLAPGPPPYRVPTTPCSSRLQAARRYRASR